MYYKFYLASSNRREYFRHSAPADLCWCKQHIFQSCDKLLLLNFFLNGKKKKMTSKKCQYHNLKFLVNVIVHFEKM